MLLAILPFNAYSQSYAMMGVRNVSFSASEFDRKYVVEDSVYKIAEFGSDVSSDFDIMGMIESDDKDNSNLFLRIGIKDWYMGLEQGKIKGRIVQDSGTDFGEFESTYKMFSVSKSLEKPGTKIDDSIFSPAAIKLGVSLTQYATPYLFGVGDGYGSVVPAVQDDDLQLTALGVYFEYDPVTYKTLALFNAGAGSITDWFFLTRSTYSLYQAKTSDAFNQALQTTGKWNGFGLSGHYELGVFMAKSTGFIAYTLQASYFLRAHMYNMLDPGMLSDPGAGEVEAPSPIHILSGLTLKASIVW